MGLADSLSLRMMKRPSRRGVVRFPRSVNWRRVFVLPTRHGYMVAFAILGVFAIGVRIQNNMLLLMAIALFVIFMFSLIWSATNLDKFSFMLVGKPYLIAGRAVRVDLAPSGRQRLNDVWLRGTEASDRKRPELAYDNRSLSIGFSTDKRGKQDLPPIMVETRFPFGVARAWTYISGGEVLVAPVPDFAGCRSYFQIGHHTHAADLTGENGADGLDSWQPGTPLNRISWKHFAASDRLLQKSGDEGGANTLFFSYAHVAHLGHEAALSVLCAAVLQAADLRQNFHLELPAVSYRDLPPSKVGTALDALACA